MKFCSSCGKEISENAAFCANCGASVESGQRTAPVEQHIYIHHEKHIPEPKPSRKNGLGVAGFVLSLVSIVLSVIPVVGLVGLITDVPAFLLALAGLINGICKKKKLGLAIAAIVLSICAVILMGVYLYAFKDM